MLHAIFNDDSPRSRSSTPDPAGSPASSRRSRLSFSSLSHDPSSAVSPSPSNASIHLWQPDASVALMSGWITKRGGMVKTWKQRFMVLMTDGQLFYFKTNAIGRSNKPLGELDLRSTFVIKQGDAVDETIEWPEGCNPKTRFQIVTKARTLSVVAPERECKRWLQELYFVRRHVLPSAGESQASEGADAAAAPSPFVSGLGATLKDGAAHSPQSRANELLRIVSLAKLGSNEQCFDCGMAPTSWVSCRLQVFLCMRCAIIHRTMPEIGAGPDDTADSPAAPAAPDTADGPAPSIRCIHQGALSEVQLKTLEHSGGNVTGRRIYEPELPPGYRRPAESNAAMREFCARKYVRKEFMRPAARSKALGLKLGAPLPTT